MRLPVVATVFALSLSTPFVAQAAAPTSVKPTIVLVHGAFAGSSSWNPVITRLTRDGYPVIAAAVPLRTLKGDASYIGSLVASLPGEVVLVGHSYGGEVISVAAANHRKVKALVFIAGLAPDVGESAASLGKQFPMGMLSAALAPPVPLADGSADLYILQARYWKQFAADLPEAEGSQMAVTQRPVAQSALAEPAAAESWRSIPSWFAYGQLDRNIPANLHAYLARRAKARESVEVPGASHVLMLSHPDLVAAMIERAGSAPARSAEARR
ncbi:alpha/beta hydrolase [Sphingomonas sp. BN140010]|uniref:Alpha/beta hydrolase n=1 Tax=Sphingomonas arvum TaxID=2992113 RepID=A0ABT3JEV6_9SPHN|nr:alpha/beta hydrolase [Sphingomonas sp. BN140010]MCW3797603.1 alpha/beta hydrolase [Sphingomonas sp. BN140010]